jgi:hypothetical protein
MKNLKTGSPKFLRQRKFLMVLPLLVVPFITMAFWALGGGKIDESRRLENETKGLNMELPGIGTQKKQELDKFELYEKAQSDSQKLREAKRNDPYADMSFEGLLTPANDTNDSLLNQQTDKQTDLSPQGSNKTLHHSSSYSTENVDANERKEFGVPGNDAEQCIW